MSLGDRVDYLEESGHGRRWLFLALGSLLTLLILGQSWASLHIFTQLDRVERLWTEQAPKRYEYTIDLPIQRPDLFFTPWNVKVDEERVVQASSAYSGDAVVPPQSWRWTAAVPRPMTIDQIFPWIRSVILEGYFEDYISKAWDNALVFVCKLDIPRLSRWACDRTCKPRVPRWVRIEYDPVWGYPVRLVEHLGDPLGCWTAYKRPGGRDRVIFEIRDFCPY